MIAGSARIVSALDDVPGGVIPGRASSPATTGDVDMASSSPDARPRRARRNDFVGSERDADAALIVVTVAESGHRGEPSSRPNRMPRPRRRRWRAGDSGQHQDAPVLRRASSVHLYREKAVSSDPMSQPGPQMVAERREVADAAAPTRYGLARAGQSPAAAQEPAAGASVAAAASVPPPRLRRRATISVLAKALEQRLAGDSTSSFEGCYRHECRFVERIDGDAAWICRRVSRFRARRPSPLRGARASPMFAPTRAVGA